MEFQAGDLVTDTRDPDKIIYLIMYAISDDFDRRYKFLAIGAPYHHSGFGSYIDFKLYTDSMREDL